MPKYTFEATQYYQIEIEADNEDRAFEIAIETPFTEWKRTGTEVEVGLEEQEGEESQQ
jgi:hypothetical protein